MNGEELRGLLQRVEKHGGPLRAEPNIVGEYIVLYRAGLNYEGNGYAEEWCRLDVAQNDRHADRIVGALKRDLIERGYGMRVLLNSTGSVLANVYAGILEVSEAGGDSELEALLHAWLAAAEAEGWSA